MLFCKINFECNVCLERKRTKQAFLFIDLLENVLFAKKIFYCDERNTSIIKNSQKSNHVVLEKIGNLKNIKLKLQDLKNIFTAYQLISKQRLMIVVQFT